MFVSASSLFRSFSFVRSWHAIVAGFALCSAAMLPTTSSGTTVLQLNEAQMVSMSSFIVRGKVVSQKAIPGPRGMGVVTLVTIQVAEELVGRNSPKTVVVRHFGGTLNGRDIRMIGGVSFAKDAEVVVFVQQSPYLPKGEYLLVGLNQGKWLVHRPAANANVSLPKSAQEPVLVRTLNHVHMVAQPGQVATAQLNRVSLSSMRTRLQQHYKVWQTQLKAKTVVMPKVRLPKVNVQVKPQAIKPQVQVVEPTPRRPVPTPVQPKK